MEFDFLNQIIAQPTILKFTESWGLHWSGLALSLSILLCFVLIHWMVQRQRGELTHAHVFDFMIYLTFGAFIGSRLFYCLFLDSEIFFQFRETFPYWGVFETDEGGFSSFGAIVGVLMSTSLFAFKTGVNRPYLFDLSALCAPVVLFLTRVSSFLTGELFGGVATDFPIRVRVPNEILYWPIDQFSKLDQIKEMVPIAGIDASDWSNAVEAYNQSKEAQVQMHSYLVRFVDYFTQRPEEYFRSIYPLLQDRYPVQLIEAGIEGFLLFLIVFLAWKSPRRPGVVATIFLIFFSISEFALDQIRYKTHLEAGTLFGIPHQILIAGVFFVIGILMFLVWNRSEILKTPGWGRARSVRIHRR